MAPALNLAFTADDYLVTWQLPADTADTFEAHGALTVGADSPPTGIAHGTFPHIEEQLQSGGAGFPQSVEVPRIVGRTSSGANVLLMNAHVMYLFTSQARITADAAIFTLAPVDGIGEPRFQALDIQVTGLDAIAGVGPIKSTTFPTTGSAGTWSAELNEDITQSWSNGGSKLTLDFRGSFRAFDPFSFGMGFSPVLRIDFTTPLPLRTLFDEWSTPIRNIVSIATGRPERLTYAALTLPDADEYERNAQVFGTGISQAPYEATSTEVQEVNSPLRLKTDGVSLLNLVLRWQQMAASHHPLVETYGSMLHAADQHPRSRFLLLIQAIEGTHGYETKESFDKRTLLHQKTRQKVSEAACDVLDDKQMKFLAKNLGKYPPSGLVSALSWLAQRLPNDSYKRLDRTPLVASLQKPPVGATSTADAIRIIRNDLAHGNRGYGAHELRPVVNLLDRMVRGLALQLLGCPDAVVERLFQAD